MSEHQEGSDVVQTKPNRRRRRNRNNAASTTTSPDQKGGIGALRTMSTLLSRLGLATKAGLSFGGLRDLYAVFGYNKKVTATDFLAKYIRQDIASRIVDAPPDATWSKPPELVSEASLITKWTELNEKHNLFGVMHRVDRLARLNHFALIILGIGDGNRLDTQAAKGKDLLYVNAVGSRMVREVTFNSDETSERFGKPEKYRIEFDNPANKKISNGDIATKGLKTLEVHWSRVIHVADNPLEDTTFSTPIMEKVYNLLDDLLKVTGGTAETYWLTGNRGMQVDIDKDMDLGPEDEKAMSDELDEFQHQLRRYVRTRGVKMTSLGGETPSPSEPFEMIMALISGTTGIPRRILLGSEAGQLASEQDRANWAERIEERRILFAQPVILRPLIERLQLFGMIPSEKVVEYKWPKAFVLSPLENGMMMAQKARAIGNMSRQTGNKEPMQITTRAEAREILELEGDIKDSDLHKAIPEGETSSTVPPPEESAAEASAD